MNKSEALIAFEQHNKDKLEKGLKLASISPSAWKDKSGRIVLLTCTKCSKEKHREQYDLAPTSPLQVDVRCNQCKLEDRIAEARAELYDIPKRVEQMEWFNTKTNERIAKLEEELAQYTA